MSMSLSVLWNSSFTPGARLSTRSVNGRLLYAIKCGNHHIWSGVFCDRHSTTLRINIDIVDGFGAIQTHSHADTGMQLQLHAWTFIEDCLRDYDNHGRLFGLTMNNCYLRPLIHIDDRSTRESFTNSLSTLSTMLSDRSSTCLKARNPRCCLRCSLWTVKYKASKMWNQLPSSLKEFFSVKNFSNKF